MKDSEIFSRIAEALLVDYSSIYYVNAKTNEYRWYSVDPVYNSLHIAHEGKDFFKSMKLDAEKIIYEEDRHIFTEDIQKENLLSVLRGGDMRRFEYRIMIDGKPVYHTIRAIRGITNKDDDFFIFGVINIDKEVRIRESARAAEKERDIYNQIAHSLAENYETIYYIDIETSEYFEFSSSDRYKELRVPNYGKNFFAETRKNAKKFAHPDDLEFAVSLYNKKTMLRNLEGQKTFSYRYRLVMDGVTKYYGFTVSRSDDEKHLIMGVKDVNDEIIAEKALKAKQKISITYGQIAESLAANYDVIYYVNINAGDYIGYTTNPIYGGFEIQEEGKNFFEETIRNSEIIVHKDDRERVLRFLGRDNVISMLDSRKQFSIDYRLVIEDATRYTRLTVMRASDKEHVIIGVENIDEMVKKEKEHLRALNTEKELARRDDLTGTKNKTAYNELAAAVQSNIDSGMDYLPFALVVCDINGLKEINDTVGHQTGDDYIRECAKLICNIFIHSPVFRIGGDEFVVFVRGGDYSEKEKLFGELRGKVRDNIGKKGRPVIAAGMAAYDPERDKSISEVFDRADNMMYNNKRELKKQC